MKIFSKLQTKISDNNHLTTYLTGSGILSQLHKQNELKDENHDKLFVLADKIVFDLYGKKVLKSLQNLNKTIIVFLLRNGEQDKNLKKAAEIINFYLKEGISRNSLIINIGGGVVTDMGGFVASIILRGIDFINIPTTLLAQVDAAIGGKNGVNLWAGKSMYKNMIGTFKQAKIVISDIDTLFTLPETEIKNALGEIVKYWVGWGKPKEAQISNLKSQTDQKKKILTEIISVCQKIKVDIMKKDPLETKGIRQKLNLGHTIGHAIEGASQGKYSHGECVGIGIAAAGIISLKMGILSPQKYQRIIDLIKTVGLPVQARNIDKKQLFEALSMDKKRREFVLIEDIGKLVTGVKVKEKLIKSALEEVVS